jgi:hypothetical protein
LETRLQAPVTSSERHLERNQKVPGSLQVSLRGSYRSLKAGFQKSSCTLLTKRCSNAQIIFNDWSPNVSHKGSYRELKRGFAEIN